MRVVITGMLAAALATPAAAADYLRGSTYDAPTPVSYNWSGFYVGGQAGYANTDVRYSGATRDMTAHLLRLTTIEQEAQVSSWPSLPGRNTRGSSYGGFVGYNAQWDDVVLGLEVNYNSTSLRTSSSDLIARRFLTSDKIQYDGIVSSSATMHLTDYGTVRARAGWAWGWIMPYATVGLAVGRADFTRSVDIALDRTDTSTTPPTPLGIVTYSDSEVRKSAILYGYSAGGGVDIGLMPGVFIRGEYEFVQFNRFHGISATVNTFRAAAAVKF
jgi:outer membrane immunogenic protein